MKWVTREYVHVDRTACPWLIKKFIDPSAEFVFVPTEKIDEIVREGATPFDVSGVKLGHTDSKCSFESILDEYKIRDPVLNELSKIIHSADTGDQSSPIGPGLDVIMTGIRFNSIDDYDAIAKAEPIYNALYSFSKYVLLCKEYEQEIKGLNNVQRKRFLHKKIKETFRKNQDFNYRV